MDGKAGTDTSKPRSTPVKKKYSEIPPAATCIEKKESRVQKQQTVLQAREGDRR